MLGGRRRRILGQRGDTIVEVLICIAIISLVLGGAFATTSKSLASTRDSQERSDGLKLVESQLEQIKELANNTTGAQQLFATTGTFCISGYTITQAIGNACRMKADGSAPTSEPIYTIAITRDAATDTFTIRNTWTSTRGLPANIQMKYRIHQ